MGEVIVITSGKGGVGKTTSSANIGYGLASFGKKVILLDADIGLRNLDVVLGVENNIIYNMIDVIEGYCDVEKAIVKDKDYEDLHLLPAAQTKDKDAVNEEQMIELTDTLRQMYDYVIIDCPAGIEQGFKNAIAGADKAIIVTTPEISAVRDADRIIGLLDEKEVKDQRLIINRLRMDMIKRGEMMSVEDVEDILSIDIIGKIPDSEDVVISTNNGNPIIKSKESICAKAYINICKRIMGEDVEYLNLDVKMGFFAKLRKAFR